MAAWTRPGGTRRSGSIPAARSTAQSVHAEHLSIFSSASTLSTHLHLLCDTAVSVVPPGVLKLHVHISNTSLKLWHVFFNHSIIKWSDCVNSAFVRSLTYRVRMCTNVCVITETHWSEHFSFLLVFVPIAGIIVLMLAASNTRMPSITCCRNHHCCSCVRSCSYGHGERGCQQRGSPGTFFHWVIGELVNPELLSYTSLQLYPPATAAAAGPTPTANIMNTFPSSPETFASSFVSLSVLLVPLFLFLYFFSINFLVFV